MRLPQTVKSITNLHSSETCFREELGATISITNGWPVPKDQQNKTGKFLSVYGMMYAIVNSCKNKGKALKEHIRKDYLRYKTVTFQNVSSEAQVKKSDGPFSRYSSLC